MEQRQIKRIQQTDHRANWQPGEIRFVTCADLASDARKLVNFVPHDCQGIVAAPRSSLIPATVVATLCHLPIYSLQGGKLVAIGAGSRGRFLKRKGRFFVVEDTSHSGRSIRRCKSILGNAAIYGCVYALKPQDVDCYSVQLPSPHILEWNIFNNSILRGGAADGRLVGTGCGCDFDGILCEDCHFHHTDGNEEQVIEWIRNAPPKYVPRFSEVPLVCSMRLEKHREHIQHWLDKWGIRVKKLVLNQSRSFAERDRSWDYSFKGIEANNLRCNLFFESSIAEAPLIAQLAKCPVIVPASGKVVLP